MIPVKHGELSWLWNMADGDFGCIVDGIRTVYLLDGRPVPWFQRDEAFHFFANVLPAYQMEMGV